MTFELSISSSHTHFKSWLWTVDHWQSSEPALPRLSDREAEVPGRLDLEAVPGALEWCQMLVGQTGSPSPSSSSELKCCKPGPLLGALGDEAQEISWRIWLLVRVSVALSPGTALCSLPEPESMHRTIVDATKLDCHQETSFYSDRGTLDPWHSQRTHYSPSWIHGLKTTM